MKQESTLLSSATEEELLVAEILLDLPNIIKQDIIKTQCKSQQHSLHFSELTWTCKRRRSSLHLDAPLLVNNLQKDEFEQVKHQDISGAAATATPDTPLDFVSSESDEKSNKNCIKNTKSKKQYKTMIKELSETNEVLKREVEIVRKYKDKLEDLNSKYKEMKDDYEELKTGQLKKQSKKEIYQNEMILGMQSTEQIRTVSYQQPLIENLMTQSQISAQLYSSNNGLERPNRVGRFELPDLNVSVEDAVPSQPLVGERERNERTRYREARRMRKGLMKVRKLRNAYGIKLPEDF